MSTGGGDLIQHNKHIDAKEYINILEKGPQISIDKLFSTVNQADIIFEHDNAQRFGRYVFWPSSGVCRTREPSQNFELRSLLNPRESPVLIPLAITGYKS